MRVCREELQNLQLGLDRPVQGESGGRGRGRGDWRWEGGGGLPAKPIQLGVDRPVQGESDGGGQVGGGKGTTHKTHTTETGAA